MQVNIRDTLIERLRVSLPAEGYDTPESKEGWEELINYLVEEAINSDFGKE